MIHTVKRSVKNELKRNQRISQLLGKNGNADIAGFIERKRSANMPTTTFPPTKVESGSVPIWAKKTPKTC